MADEALLHGPNQPVVRLAGVDYTAERIATLTDEINALARDLRYRDRPPFPP